ncbi:ubiquitin ligase E3, putative [Pediculus humanus corporis]|uniref:E3 ubiquitin-protein ligase n=1 Tax=Pediculus humanus subsp. corporis TaxID=121224 RepID=E0VVQ7_PEDHC|nr:ubiquitin ligase E3, putative [Pediculus humanus corporis]EEB17463.1 ubiquitin ligase E3, putative [Pediculus humanus corporis]
MKSTQHNLIKKSKRSATAAFKSSPDSLKNFLNRLLDPVKDINDSETIDWCRWLMAGGQTPEEFANEVKQYDNATICGLVWTANFVAYRCRTCRISPCMSLCAECFRNGNHDGHDFNMFRSQAGGACDCGDISVMKESGFCGRHGAKQSQPPSAPDHLMCLPNAIMPRLVLRLVQHMRENSNSRRNDMGDADAFLAMLHDFSSMGAAMRRVMTTALIDPQIYKELTDLPHPSSDPEFSDSVVTSTQLYHQALQSLPNPEFPDEFKNCPALQEHLVHNNFLEELMFWTLKFEFPQQVVCLLLNMLPDLEYKEPLTRAFVLHYSRVPMMLEKSTTPDTLSNRVVHVSVQLFSNENLALKMTNELNLLHVMVISLKFMMAKILIPNTLHDPAKNFHLVVDCSQDVMKEHCYWPLVSDLNNILSHQPVAHKFMSDSSLLEMWFNFLSMFQGMNVNRRELYQHVEFEPSAYYAAFSVELEGSAYPLWALVSHLKDSSTLHLTKNILNGCISALQDWFDAINFTQPVMTDHRQVSFHLPLHRYLAILMNQAVKCQGVTLKQMLPPLYLLELVYQHPLRLQVIVKTLLSIIIN